jgi:hypothetical protein
VWRAEWDLNYAARRRASSALSQLVKGFELMNVWSTILRSLSEGGSAGPWNGHSVNLSTPRSSFLSSFGRFTTYENYNPAFVLHNQQGTLRPGGENDATKRFYQFKGNVLRLGTPPNVNAAGETTGGHLYWEKMTPVK